MTSIRAGRDGSVRQLSRGDADAASAVLCAAFRDYPVMRHVLRDAGHAYERRLRSLVRYFVACRFARNEFVLGVPRGDGLSAVALVTVADGRENPAELDPIRDALWRELGPAARARYEGFGATCARFHVPEPHLHLNMIGVAPEEQGRGRGRVLLDRVHALSRERADSIGVTLTTEEPANVPIYEHVGYERLGHEVVSSGLETWGFLRRDTPATNIG